MMVERCAREVRLAWILGRVQRASVAFHGPEREVGMSVVLRATQDARKSVTTVPSEVEGCPAVQAVAMRGIPALTDHVAQQIDPVVPNVVRQASSVKMAFVATVLPIGVVVPVTL